MMRPSRLQVFILPRIEIRLSPDRCPSEPTVRVMDMKDGELLLNNESLRGVYAHDHVALPETGGLLLYRQRRRLRIWSSGSALLILGLGTGRRLHGGGVLAFLIIGDIYGTISELEVLMTRVSVDVSTKSWCAPPTWVEFSIHTHLDIDCN